MPARQIDTPGRAPLTREEISTAAIGLIEREGTGALTMRRLAAEIGCGTMSMYTHVRNRDDLLEAVIQRLIARLDVKSAPGESWQDFVRRSLRSYRALALDQPRAFEVLALAPDDTEAMSAHLAAYVAVLESSGLDRDAAEHVLSVSDAFASGFLLLWVRSRNAQEAHDDPRERREIERFDRGVETLIAGLEQTI
jgi:AcrR family transcriptional regulator